MIFAQSDADSTEFTRFVQDLSHRLFPLYEMQDVPANHPLYSVLYKVKPEPPPKPVAPPLPFTYMGSYAPNGAKPVFFLTQGDRVYDVHIGDTLDGTYSVDAFNNGALVFTYKPLNQQQQLTTGGAP